MSDYNAQMRAAMVTLLLITGHRLTTAEIAQRVGLTRRGARRLMLNVSLVLPITQIEVKWQWISPKGTNS